MGYAVAIGIGPVATSLPGLVAWWRADSGISTADIIAGTVSSWTPLAGSFPAATQGTGANQPSYLTSWHNGKPAVRSTASQWLSTIQITSVGTLLTYVWAGQLSSGSTMVVADAHFTAGNNYQLLGISTNKFELNDISAAPAQATNVGFQSPCTAMAIGAITAQPTNNLYLNGTSLASNTTTGNGQTCDGFTLCNNNGHTNGGTTIGELIVYNRQLTSTEVAQLYASMKAFWGTP